MSCRTQGEFPDVCLSVFPNVPPLWPIRPQINTPQPLLAPQSPQISPSESYSSPQASNQPSMPQICPLGLKPALQTWNLPFRCHACPPGLKSASQASNLPFSSKICPLALKSMFIALTDVWKFTTVFYRTLVHWGRCPGLTAFHHLITPNKASSTADHVRSFDD